MGIFYGNEFNVLHRTLPELSRMALFNVVVIAVLEISYNLVSM